MTNNVFEELKWRGLVFDATEGVEELLAQKKVSFYTGFDPTGDSLHVGSLVPIIGLARLQRFGHTPIALAGGGTGMIGDPSGKTQERQLLSLEQVQHNVECIKQQLARFLDFDCAGNPARLVNNADWLGSMSILEFLRDVGKHFTVNYMTAKESVKSRIEREDGISYTEFSYMLLQGYDFYHLFKHHDCVLQTGGSDQWGNITTGMELVRRMDGKRGYGLVYPLITKSDGTKFGKTEEGTIWLDPQKTSAYRFYQFWMNTDDRDVDQYLKYFTFLTREEIAELRAKTEAEPHKREAQIRLAEEMTRTVHGDSALSHARKATQALFGGDISGLDATAIEDIFADVPSAEIAREGFAGAGYSLIDLMADGGVTKSKGEARRLIQGGGVYVNNQKIDDVEQRIDLDNTIEGRYIVLRKGRKNYHLVKLSD
ncbi:MAG: tyrosine--tRNA ligase [Gammaproteobacteria bacterium]|nr:tyrosine--tRNA ligase [Gammaproteobacteria bacterium]